MAFKRKISSLLNIIVTGMLVLSCQQGEFEADTVMQEVFFNTQVVSEGFKNSQRIDYALIQINDSIYKPDAFVLNGTLYTQAIKLIPGIYHLQNFLMMNNNNTPNNYADDYIVLASPVQGSEFATFVNYPAGFEFNVDNFKKSEVNIEVIYFNEADYDKFGLSFGFLPHSTVRNQIFRGYFTPCHDLNVYNNSLYAQQNGGIQSQMKAIFRVDVYRNGRFVKSYSNENSFGDSTVSVIYPDDNNNPDHYRFELWLYAKSGTGFAFKPVHSWEFNDNQSLETGNNGVVDFIIGSTTGTNYDYSFGPYIDLPLSAILTLDSAWAPGSLQSYFNGIISGVEHNHQLDEGVYAAWCGTDSINININYNYSMDVYNSLFSGILPAYIRYEQRWNEINWLFNHLNNLGSFSWQEVQGAVWLILNDWDGSGHQHIPNLTPAMEYLANTAKNHPDFTPSCGDKFAVIFVPHNTTYQAQQPKIQVTFILLTI